MAPPRIPLEERFIKHTDRSGGEDACWIWTGCKRRKGYGSITVHGKSRVASRVAYEFYYGPIPENMFVCHSCDNPPCINPKHLFLGTPLDNMKDRDGKGRHGYSAPHRIRRGEENNMTKLTSQQVLEIRQLREQGASYSRLVKMFGISKTNVSDIIHRRIWQHIPETHTQISADNTGFYETLIVTAPDGTEQIIHDVSKFCQEHHLDYSTLMRVAKSLGKGTAYRQHKGYKARYPETDEG